MKQCNNGCFLYVLLLVVLVVIAPCFQVVSAKEQQQQRQQCEVGHDGSCIVDPKQQMNDAVMPRYYVDINGESPIALSNEYDDDNKNTMQELNTNYMKHITEYNNFHAYIRPDISTYYRNNKRGTDNTDTDIPTKIQEIKPTYNGLAGKFINMTPNKMSLYWARWNGGYLDPPVLISDLEPFGSGGTATFPGHFFFITKYNVFEEILCNFTIQPNVMVNYCNPYLLDPENEHKNVVYKHSVAGDLFHVTDKTPVWKLSTLSKTDREKYDGHLFNLEFGDRYQDFTNGSPWLTMYPPNQLQHFVWPADYFGQEHLILTNETHFHSIPSIVIKNAKKRLTMDQMKNPSSSLLESYRHPGLLNITLKVVSCTPRVFEIHNFLSDTEVDHMIQLVDKQTLERSTTGGRVSTTRTSKTTWIARDKDYIMNAIYRRVATVVRIHEALLRQRHQKNDVTSHSINHYYKINEDMQIVHYDAKQEYTAHHDFGYPTGLTPDDKLTRSLNFAMYLNNVTEGGQTSFPRYRNALSGNGLNIQPEKGKAVLFYMVNPDGNLEDLSQHAGLPVIVGEKYFANLWLHTYLPKV